MIKVLSALISEFSEFSEFSVKWFMINFRITILAYSPHRESKMVFPTIHIAAYEFHFNIVVYPLPETEKKTVSV